MATAYRSGDFALTVGASFRMIVDVGRWDRSLAINTPGQSGDPGSPHYRDLAPCGHKAVLSSALHRAAIRKSDHTPA
jgi:penicillin amidase